MNDLAMIPCIVYIKVQQKVRSSSGNDLSTIHCLTNMDTPTDSRKPALQLLSGTPVKSPQG